ncbi:MAG: hypothetical protein AAGL90_07355 [Pseudomonadota bacterium]
MTLWGRIRHLLLWIGVIGFIANTAQARVEVDAGETLALQVCNEHGALVELELPGAPPEQKTGGHCQACYLPALAPRFEPISEPCIWIAPVLSEQIASPRVFPRSPLWPGAPPNGPPFAHAI